VGVGDHILGAVRVKYLAIEHALPSRVVENDEIIEQVLAESRANLSAHDLRRAERLMRATFKSAGTTRRFCRAPGERAHELCLDAGRRALATANLEPSDIDLLIYVGVGRGFLEPATANVFQDLLGLHNATCFDVLDACASWLRAIHIARSFIQTGAHRNILILNAEFNAEYASFALRSVEEFDHRFPTYTIGEAATATIVSESQEEDRYHAEFRSFGRHRELCFIPLPNCDEYMAGKQEDYEPFRFISYGAELMEFGLARLVEQYRETPAFSQFDPDIVFFHAASDGMARAGMRECGLAEVKGYYTHGRFANTVSATIPLAMSEALGDGSLSPGDDVLFSVASAGVSTALCRFRYLG
jgi:3-oxoacyl-[acyl-carrier-protein] synthase III